MFYRSSNKILIAALIAAALGAFAPTRADDRTSDLEAKLKQKEAEYKELQQKLQSQQAQPPEQPTQTITTGLIKRSSDQGWLQAEQARAQADAARDLNGQLPFRFSVQVGSGSAIKAAAEGVRDAKGDDDRKAAQKKLDEALSKYFDDDMVQREKELKQVEERVTKLRELLERRRASKQEIIDLESKVALNEANGLGFYDGEPSGGPPLHPFFGYKTSASGSGGGFSSSISSSGGIAQRVKVAPPGPPTKTAPEGESPQPK